MGVGVGLDEVVGGGWVGEGGGGGGGGVVEVDGVVGGVG